ncbi:BA14K family protein [Methylobrevis pamukkalensis]|uniref:Lectin-like protein BA14k n=1 Tax=Methylobrevis pamukkalensis TaxID=1439726 RepID=A0A1E3GY49_9HYPH|nr:BA14K family protein [Methylobrevis pamukkalensis]ODN68980.1 BA14K-like protein [Methylobrevis pamukkalensis]
MNTSIETIKSASRRGLSALLAATMAVGSITVVSLPLTTTEASAGDRIWYRDRGHHRHYRPGPVARRHVWGSHAPRYVNRRYYGGRYYYGNRGYSNGDLAAAGVVGLAAGALLGAAVTAPPRVTYAPAPAYSANGVPGAGGYPPFSAGWHSYCSSKYRSFDAGSGTYLGYDGYRHYCQ